MEGKTGPTIKNQKYKTGAIIPFDGYYQIFHTPHRLPQEMLLISGDVFPRCAKCDKPVSFVLLREARADFVYERIRLYEISVLEDEDRKADSATNVS